ncbi:hypothetical protein ACIQJW_32255 [Streptomyces californicus]|uniref:hypothetical protein n=1 Tax=Streptomyces californicus TaxID=67351 RepID=UPI0038241539
MAAEHGEGDCGEATDLGLDPLGKIVSVKCADGPGEQREPVGVCRRPSASRDGPQGQPDDEHALGRAQVGSEGDEALHPAPVSTADFLVGLPKVGQGGGAARFGIDCLAVVLCRHALGVVIIEGGVDVVGEPLVPGDGQQILKRRADVGGQGEPQREACERMSDASGAFVQIALPAVLVAVQRGRRDRTASAAARGYARWGGGQSRTEGFQVAQESFGEPGIREQVGRPCSGGLGLGRGHSAQGAVRVDDEHDVAEAWYAVAVDYDQAHTAARIRRSRHRQCGLAGRDFGDALP